jgi:hypothetical protein
MQAAVGVGVQDRRVHIALATHGGRVPQHGCGGFDRLANLDLRFGRRIGRAELAERCKRVDAAAPGANVLAVKSVCVTSRM